MSVRKKNIKFEPNFVQMVNFEIVPNLGQFLGNYYGEKVCAWIKVAQGHKVSEDDIKVYLSERIAHFKVPSVIRFVDKFPLTVTGKLQKYKMREFMESEQRSMEQTD